MRYPEDERDELGAFIAQMQRISQILRSLGLGMLLLTMINLGAAAAIGVGLIATFEALLFSTGIFITVVMLGMVFERYRRDGEAIYGEVTDELHRARSDESSELSRSYPSAEESSERPRMYSPRVESSERPRMSFRIALKNFASSMELPLIPGRYGVSIYLSLNLAVTAFALLVRSAYR